MGYDLGIDLGGTSVAAAVCTDACVQMVSLGDHTVTAPAVVFLDDDGTLIAGEAAARRAAERPDRAGRELRRRLGGSTPVRLGGTPYPPAALLGAVLQDAVARVAESVGSKPDSVLLTHPAHWSPARRAALTEAIREAGPPEVRTATEPEAVAAHYAEAGQLADGDTVAVYDLGGGSFDAAVLRRDAGAVELVGLPEGIERLGGSTFDEAILSHVNQATDNPLAGLDRRDPRSAAAVARLREQCQLAKETLSVQTSATIPVQLPNRQADVTLTRAEFEQMIHGAIQTTIGALLKALQSAQLDPAELATVLLVGGSARIPLVNSMLTASLARPTVLDAHPKHPVALGAATLAAAARRSLAGPGRRDAPAAGREVPDPTSPVRDDAARENPVPDGQSPESAEQETAEPQTAERKTAEQETAERATAERKAAAPVTDSIPVPDQPARVDRAPVAAAGRRPEPVDAPTTSIATPPAAPHRVAPAATHPAGPTTRFLPTEPAVPAPVNSPVSLFDSPTPAGARPAPDPGLIPVGAAPAAPVRAAPATAAAAGPAPDRARPSFLLGSTVIPTPRDAVPTADGPTPPPYPTDRAADRSSAAGQVPPVAPPPAAPAAGEAAAGRAGRRRLAVLAAVALVVVLAGMGYLLWERVPVASTAAPAPPSAAPAPGGPPVAAAASGPSPRVRSTVPVGETPGFVVVSPDGRRALVANQAAGVITVVDTATNTVTDRIAVSAGPPQYLAFSPDGRRVYVSIWDQARTVAAVGVLDTESDTIVATIPVRTRPYLSAVTPDGQRLYVPNHDSGTISVIDTGTNTVTAEIKVAANPHWIEMSADGTRAYAANHESNLVSVIDTTDNGILAEVPVQTSPHSLAVRPDQSVVANVNYDAASVTVIDTDDDEVVSTIPVGANPQDITWAPDGQHAYVVNSSDGTVSVIDGDTAAVTATVPVGDSPTSVAVLPDGSAAYVSNLDDGTLAVLDIAG